MKDFFPIFQIGYAREDRFLAEMKIDYKKNETLIKGLSQNEKDTIKELLRLEIEKLG
jgi:hypothetical protein